MTILSLIAVGSSLLVVTAPNTVISVLWLVVVFITTSILLGLTGLGYAALLYVIVYVGAIAIIFLFVVQLLGSVGKSSASHSGHASLSSRTLLTNSTGSGTLPIATAIALSILYIISNYLELSWSMLSTSNLISDGHQPQILISFMYDLFNYGNSSLFNGPSVFVSNATTSSFETLAGQISTFNTSSVYNLAEWLYGGATLPLIIASIVLLLAMIAPIVLCSVS